LGTIRAQQGRLDEAETLFLRSIRADKRYVGPHLNLAYLYTLKKQPDKTISELQQVLILDPKNYEALDRLARLLLVRNRLAEGIQVLEQAAKSQTIPIPLLLLLGDAYLKKGDAAKAEENYQRLWP
jgi:tetratricopeptide (TPR) repeat protein